jgi:phage shock protein A
MKREQIVSPRVEIAEKIHEELLVSLELERKLLQKELTVQETMTERVVVRKELMNCERKIKDLTEQLQKENDRSKVTKWKPQQP